MEKVRKIKLTNIEIDTDNSWYSKTKKQWYFEGIAYYKIGHKKYFTWFLSGSELKICRCGFWERSWTNKKNYIPTNKEEREKLLELIYGEMGKLVHRIEIINYFEEKEKEKKEE